MRRLQQSADLADAAAGRAEVAGVAIGGGRTHRRARALRRTAARGWQVLGGLALAERAGGAAAGAALAGGALGARQALGLVVQGLGQALGPDGRVHRRRALAV